MPPAHEQGARTAVVVGGGVAGLVAARELAARGFAVTVLEARPVVGGTVAGAELDGVMTDIGAEAFAITRPEAAALVAELGLADVVVEPARSDARLWRADGTVVIPRSLMGVPCDLDAPELLAAIGADATARAKALDAAPFGPAPFEGVDAAITLGSLTLGALVRRRMGDAVADRILTPVVAGVHAIDPDLVEAESICPGLIASARAHGSLAAGANALRAASGRPGSAINSLRGGMTTLGIALHADAERRGVRIETGVDVTGVRPDGDGWKIAADGRTREADVVVVAVPAPVAARIVDVPSVAGALARIDAGDVAVVSLVVEDARLDDAPVGSGVLVDPGQTVVQAKALTHSTAKWAWAREAFGPGRHLLRLSYGRDGHIGADLATLVPQAHADACAIVGLDLPAPAASRVTPWRDALVHQRPGHRASTQGVLDAVAATPGLLVVGAGLGGNGIAGTVAHAERAVAALG